MAVHTMTDIFSFLSLLLIVNVTSARIVPIENTEMKLHKLSFRRYPEPIQHGTPGKKIKFFCKVKGHPKLSVIWYKGSEVILEQPAGNVSRIKLFPDSLVINPYEEGDAGNYSCKAETKSGHRIRANFTLVTANSTWQEVMKNDQQYNKESELKEGAESAPTWIRKDRRDLYFPAGSQVKLRCHAEGNPSPKVIWKKGNKKKWMGPTVVIKKLNSRHGGEYECIAENKLGRITHKYKLHVIAVSKRLPPVVEGITNQTVNEGGVARFQCIVSSGSSPYIEWLKVSSVNTTGGTSIKQELSIVKNKNTGKYVVMFVIQNVTSTDAGLYTCQAINASGRASMSAWLTLSDGIDDDRSEKPITKKERSELAAETISSAGGSFLYRWQSSVSFMAAVMVIVSQ